MKAIVIIELEDFEERFGDSAILADDIRQSIRESFDLAHGRYVMVKGIKVEVKP